MQYGNAVPAPEVAALFQTWNVLVQFQKIAHHQSHQTVGSLLMKWIIGAALLLWEILTGNQHGESCN